MLIHGWTADSHDWSWQLPVLEGKYRVVAVDLRGHGRSQIMPSGSYDPEDYVADIEALIERDFPGQKFILVGHSMGGQIAARLSVKRPDLVGGVISVDGSLGFSDALGPIFRKTTMDLKRKDPAIVGPALFEAVYDPATDPGIKRWHARRLQGTSIHAVRESFGPLFFGASQVGLGKQSEDFLRTVRVPFYHLCRDQEQEARMRGWFSNPKSRVEYWDHAGHWIMQDRKEDVTSAIVAWIDAL
ncbi:alpha/beta hydrolase [Novosphingobium sp. BL-8H]|uniref:alpha/beta fold hydrolase n=1 Tax=Novosphingobium sp. BL-8H TaxID=3127640 RepID=UPI003757D438